MIEAHCPSCSQKWGMVSRSMAMLRRQAAEIAEAHGYTLCDIQSTRRPTALKNARWQAILTLSQMGASSTQIGRALNKDHTSILYALRKAQDLNGSE